MKKNIWHRVAEAAVTEKGMGWDNSDERDPAGRRGAPPVPSRPTVRTGPNPNAPRQNPTSHLPGLPPQKVKKEARPRHDTIPLPTNYQSPGMIAQQAGNLRVNPEDPAHANAPEYDAQPLRRRQLAMTRQIPVNREAWSPADSKLRAAAKEKGNTYDRLTTRPNSQNRPTREIPVRKEGTTGASGAGFQLPMGDAAEAAKKVYREMVDEVFLETVRELPNGKFGVYMKNKGKKKAPKKVGEYPDRVAAREAELARGGKSGEAAKKERDRINKLKKDPKKLAAAKKKKSKTKRKTTKESLVNELTAGLKEALFREDDIINSQWDDRLANLSPNALASDKKLTNLIKGINKASGDGLNYAAKMMAKALKKQCRVIPGEIGNETGGKMYMPVMLDVDGDEHGPVYLYVDGGHVKMELADELDEALDGMEDGMGHNILGALMAFRQKELPKVDHAQNAVALRDKYLDSLDGKIDGQLTGLSGVELQIIKNLINQKHGRRFR